MATSLNILQWNANSVQKKRDDLLALAGRLKSDVIIISETKLKNSDKFYLPGFFTIRNDRDGGRGGGVLIAVRRNIKFRKIKINSTLESIGIKLEISPYFQYTTPQILF